MIPFASCGKWNKICCNSFSRGGHPANLNTIHSIFTFTQQMSPIHLSCFNEMLCNRWLKSRGRQIMTIHHLYFAALYSIGTSSRRIHWKCASKNRDEKWYLMKLPIGSIKNVCAEPQTNQSWREKIPVIQINWCNLNPAPVHYYTCISWSGTLHIVECSLNIRRIKESQKFN